MKVRYIFHHSSELVDILREKKINFSPLHHIYLSFDFSINCNLLLCPPSCLFPSGLLAWTVNKFLFYPCVPYVHPIPDISSRIQFGKGIGITELVIVLFPSVFCYVVHDDPYTFLSTIFCSKFRLLTFFKEKTNCSPI